MSSKKAAKRGKKKGGKGEAKAAAGAAKLGIAAQDGDCAAITGLLDSGLDINTLINMKLSLIHI